MKRIEAIIRPDKIEDVKEALAVLGHSGLTVSDVKGHGVQGGITQQWRGNDYCVDMIPKVSVVVVVHDHELQDAVDSIMCAARTGRIGDGKIFVSTIDEAIRIRTGESGAGSL
jgi:nitrogen regulatory protein P-II 1